jgi:hypothetical protein
MCDRLSRGGGRHRTTCLTGTSRGGRAGRMDASPAPAECIVNWLLGRRAVAAERLDQRARGQGRIGGDRRWWGFCASGRVAAAAGPLRRLVSPRGVDENGDARAVDDGSESATNLADASKNATVFSYDEHDLVLFRRLPWNDGDTRKFRQEFVRATAPGEPENPLRRVRSLLSRTRPPTTPSLAPRMSSSTATGSSRSPTRRSPTRRPTRRSRAG